MYYLKPLYLLHILLSVNELVRRRGVGAQYELGEVYQQRVLTPDNPGPVHNTRARGVNPSEGTFMDISQCTSAPHREPDLALSGTHGALPLENLDNLHGVAPAYLTD